MCSLLQTFGLAVVWRELHPTTHILFILTFMIDHIFMYLHHLHLVQKISIPASPCLDHNPLVLLIFLSGIVRHPPHWRINESLLTTQATCQHIRSLINTYFVETQSIQQCPSGRPIRPLYVARSSSWSLHGSESGNVAFRSSILFYSEAHWKAHRNIDQRNAVMRWL